MHYTVYKTTNLVNGKIYVGIHRTETPLDNYLGSGKRLRLAVRKYGRESFRKEILYDFDNAEEMALKEREIVDPEFIAREDTYNLARGGEDPFATVTSEQRAEWGRMGAQAFLARPDALEILGRNGATALRRFRAEGRVPPIDPLAFQGRTHTPETRAKMRAARLGKGNSQYGTCWVCREEEAPQKVPKAELEQWLAKGWSRGRKIKLPKKVKPPLLSDTKRQEIRDLYATGQFRQGCLAERFGVSQMTICRVVQGVKLPHGRQRATLASRLSPPRGPLV